MLESRCVLLCKPGIGSVRSRGGASSTGQSSRSGREGASGGLVLPACPVRGADQGQGSKKGASSAKCFRHPLGTRLQRAWEESHRARSCQAGGRGGAAAKSPYKGSRVRGGGACLTNPLWTQRGWRGERGHASPGRPHGCACLREEQREQRQMPVCRSPHCPVVPGLVSNTTMPKHPDQTALTWLRRRLRGSPNGMRGMTFKAAQARTCLAAPRQDRVAQDGPASGSCVLTRLPTNRTFLKVGRVSQAVVQ